MTLPLFDIRRLWWEPDLGVPKGTALDACAA